MPRRLTGVGLALLAAGCSTPSDRAGQTDAGQSAPPVVSAQSAAAPEVSGVVMPAGDDHARVAPRSPQDTLAAIPPSLQARGYAPELGIGDARTLFYRASKTQCSGPTGPGMLLCEVSTTQSVEDTAQTLLLSGAADLDLEIEFAGLHVEQRGPDESQSAILSLPLVALKGGETISVHLWDRDPVQRQDVGTVRATFDGTLPMSATEQQQRIVCGHLAQSVVDETAMVTLEDVDRELREVVDALDYVDVFLDDLGNGPVVSSCMHQTSRIAAFWGWGDPRVERRVTWCKAMVTESKRHTRTLLAQIESRAASSFPVALSTETTKLELGPPIRDCSKGGLDAALSRFGMVSSVLRPSGPCLMRVAVKNTGTRSLHVSPAAWNVDPALTLRTISSSGRTSEGGVLGIDGSPSYSELAPKSSATLVFVAADNRDGLAVISAAGEAPPYVIVPISAD